MPVTGTVIRLFPFDTIVCSIIATQDGLLYQPISFFFAETNIKAVVLTGTLRKRDLRTLTRYFCVKVKRMLFIAASYRNMDVTKYLPSNGYEDLKDVFSRRPSETP